MRTTVPSALALVSCLLLCEMENRHWRCCLAQKDEPPKTLDIPLQAICTTTGQKELKHLSDGFQPQKDGSKKFREPYGLVLLELRSEFRASSTNVLLAQAADITSAVRATHDVLLNGRSADNAVRGDAKSTSQRGHWLVAYLREGGSGTYRVVTSCSRRGGHIRLAYKDEQSGTGLIIVEQYFWAPLGDLEPGAYVLELFDAGCDQLELSRRVIVR